MGKKKTGIALGDKILLLLSCLARGSGYLCRDLLELSLSPTMKNCLFKASRIDAEITRTMHKCLSILKNENLIEVYGNAKIKRVRLTSLAIKRLSLSGLIKGREIKKWNGKWYLVVFDVPENKSKLRNRFRSFLYNEGFVQFQKSVFINPYDKLAEVKEKITELEIEEFARFLAIDEIDRPRELAIKLWNLEGLDRRYSAFIGEAKAARRYFSGWTLGERFSKYWNLRKRLILIISEDPYLPDPLLPKRWNRERAERALGDLKCSIFNARSRMIKGTIKAVG